MKQLYLKIQDEAIKLSNIIAFKHQEHNALIDAKKRAKKEKDDEEVAECTRKITLCKDNIIDLEARMAALDREYAELKHKCGKLRLDMYVFADVIYGTLIEYKAFIDKYVINKHGDDDIIHSVEKAIEYIKKLPAEMGEEACYRTNSLFNLVCDRFFEKYEDIRDNIICDVMMEIDKTNLKIKK